MVLKCEVRGKRERERRKRTRNISPTTQLGLLLPLGMLVPALRSKMAPRHRELLRDIRPMFMSWVLIDQSFPPNDIETSTVVEHAT